MKNDSRWVIWIVLASMLLLSSSAMAETLAAGGTVMDMATAIRTVGLGLAAALTMGVCVLGSGYAVARIGSAAMGAAAEKPELMIRSLLFVALAEGLAVLGFAIAMMLLQKI